MAIFQPPKLGLTSSYANEIFTQTSAEQTSHIKQNQIMLIELGLQLPVSINIFASIANNITNLFNYFK